MKLLKTIEQIPWIIIIFLAATIGLAPFSPPHVVEKLLLLVSKNLTKPIDWFDLFFHGFPWILCILKLIAALVIKGPEK